MPEISERPLTPPTVQIFDRSKLVFDTIQPKLFTLISKDFDPAKAVLGQHEEDPAIAINWREALMRQDSVTALLFRDQQARELIGLSYAVPMSVMDPERVHVDDTAYIYFTAVHDELQGMGNGPLVTSALIQELYQRGYRFIERDCMIENGWAASVAKHFGDAIVSSEDHDWNDVGQQTRFRIDLERYFTDHQASER